MSRPAQVNFWKATPGMGRSAIFSTVLHLLLITAWVRVTVVAAERSAEEWSKRVVYLPPPKPQPASERSFETLRYVALAPEGSGVGMGTPSADAGLPAGPAAPRGVGDAGRDSVSAPDQVASAGKDSVFTIIEVDTEAARLPGSAAPQYPRDLLEKGVEGHAVVQFVVDTTGLADYQSFRVVRASHGEFVAAIRVALPGMRFSSARIGETKVRQLVELPFNFRVARQLEPVAAKSEPPR